MGFFAKLKALFRRKKQPVLGLALGSGGAKGMAHIGALRAFEEEGISFSVVTGASIGSIVGALYANGYSSADMTGIVENLNRKEFAKNLRPFADLSFAEKFVGEYLDGNIEETKKPYACWATDAETGEGVLLNSGKIARAVTASSAVPPFFRGVEIDGRKLYDGCFSNAVPSDACRELGADIVIGIDLAAYTVPDEEKGAIARLLGAAINRFTPVKYREDSRSRGYDHADLMLRPDLRDCSATDVSRGGMDKMYERGYEEAKARIPEIKALIEGFGRRKK